MLNKRRVIVMTKMASYESTEGKKNGSIGKYYRGDYIGIQVIKSIIYATIAFLIVGGMYVLYDLENIMENLYEINSLLAIGKRVLVVYIIVIISYAMISYAIYSYRYSKARRKQKIYAKHLKMLGAMYDRENRK